jgi:hypothetical protein
MNNWNAPPQAIEPSDTRQPHCRTAHEIEQDFCDLMSSRLPAALTRVKLERLWDETNALAAQLVIVGLADDHIMLLKRIHQAFEGSER